MMDLSDALLNSTLADVTLICVRQTQTTDAHGFAHNTEETIPFTGIVTPDSGDAVHDADVVIWQKRRYTVITVKDYSAFGFVCATGELIPLSVE